jgi:FixJ family two-component response regulator
MSGYTKDSMDTDRLREIGCRFIEKPFTRDTLLDVLEGAMSVQATSAIAV